MSRAHRLPPSAGSAVRTTRRAESRSDVGLLLLAASAALLAHAALRSRDTRPQPPAAAPAPLPGRPRLVEVLGGTLRAGEPVEPRELLLNEGRQVVGRAHDADLRLHEPTVSPRHLLLEADREGRVHARDLGARNGVRVDGLPIARAELHDGNRLDLGKAQFVYRTDPESDDGGRSGGEFGENLGQG